MLRSMSGASGQNFPKRSKHRMHKGRALNSWRTCGQLNMRCAIEIPFKREKQKNIARVTKPISFGPVVPIVRATNDTHTHTHTMRSYLKLNLRREINYTYVVCRRVSTVKSSSLLQDVGAHIFREREFCRAPGRCKVRSNADLMYTCWETTCWVQSFSSLANVCVDDVRRLCARCVMRDVL